MSWPEDKDVLHSPGVVLIDEVELHLHPSWQQTVLPSLLDIFPNVQFIITVYSSQVLTTIPASYIRILKD
jgi:predicted ATP-binding protein involved in virulence